MRCVLAGSTAMEFFHRVIVIAAGWSFPVYILCIGWSAMLPNYDPQWPLQFKTPPF